MVKLFGKYHTWQQGKKTFEPIGYAIINFFGSTNMYKFSDEAHQKFIENLVLFIYKLQVFFNISTCLAS
jgi:hypothetical protein